MASSKDEFVEIIKAIREFIKSDECTDCSCPNTRCELHGDCYNCIRVYRHFGQHVPRCLQFIVDKKIASITHTAEIEKGERTPTPDEYYDYLNSVAPKESVK